MSPSKSKSKIEAMLSDSSSEEVVRVPKKSCKKVVRKVSSSSESEVQMLKQKRKPSKDIPKKVAPKKKHCDSDEESSEVVSMKKPAPKKTKAPIDSDEESCEVAPKKSAKSKKAKKSSSECESSDDDKAMKTITKKSKQTEEEDDGETHSEIMCKNLSYNSNEDSLWEYFSKFGTVTSSKVVLDKMTGKSRGFGFVGFETRSAAKKAISECGEIDGRQPTVQFSNQKPQGQSFGGGNQGGFGGNQGGYGGQPAPKRSNYDGERHSIFVGNLGFKTQENNIRKFFASCGNVVDVRIALSKEDGRPRGFCHVDFDSAEAVEAAKGKAGKNLDGREIRVDPSTPRTGGDRGGRGGDRGGRGSFRGGRDGPPRQSHSRMGDSGNRKTFDDSD